MYPEVKFSRVKVHMILSNKRITKALIRVQECEGWSVPLLFTNPEDKFSRGKAHILMH